MVEVSAENYQKQLKITDEIWVFLSDIHNDTAAFSTHNHIYNHPKFKTLVEMGDKIIPYLFHVLTQHGGSWIIFCALQQITHENPVSKGDHGKFVVVMKCWLEWYVNSKYIHHDVYFNLVD